VNHSAYRVGVERFHVATWFGCCSYRKLKVSPEAKRTVCPICQHDLVKLRYFGDNPEVRACYSMVLGSCGRVGFVADMVEDGREVWVVDDKRAFAG
jgi:hypothetical protein